MKILFFDGYCSICNGLTDWVMARDKKNQIKFASLQGETAKCLIAQSKTEFDTVVYLRDGQRWERSTAILYLLQDLGAPWSIARIFFIIPVSLRNLFYLIFAKNRYRFFKKRDTCRIPTSQEKGRLLP